MELVKQHLIVGNLGQLRDYFKKVKVFTEGESSVHGSDDLFEIPTLTIEDQLNKINEIDGLKVGLVFYFVRTVHNNNVIVQISQEMVWVVKDIRFDPYMQHKMSEIFGHQVNVDFMQKQ